RFAVERDITRIAHDFRTGRVQRPDFLRAFVLESRAAIQQQRGAHDFFMPLFQAYTAAWVRSPRPSLASMLPTCVFTVFSEISSCAAIRWLLAPSAINASTSRSRSLSEASTFVPGADRP